MRRRSVPGRVQGHALVCGRNYCGEARAMDPAEKILAGQQLFESACRMTLAGIRNQNPGASEEQCREILRQRLEWQRKLEASS